MSKMEGSGFGYVVYNIRTLIVLMQNLIFFRFKVLNSHIFEKQEGHKPRIKYVVENKPVVLSFTFLWERFQTGN